MILLVKYKLLRRVKTFAWVHVREKTDNWKAALILEALSHIRVLSSLSAFMVFEPITC